MAYSKTSNKRQDKELRYLSKDFQSFKDQLIEFTKVYYPNTFNDFSEGSPGMMFMEMAAYVGDVLSFYTDTQLKETFLSLAQEKENLFNLAYAMGYKPKISTTSTVDLDLFQLIPSKLINGSYIPDYDYTLRVNEGSLFTSTEGAVFRISERVDFGFSSSYDPTETNVYQLDTNNDPQYYLLKKSINSISVETFVKTFIIGTSEKYKIIEIEDRNIVGIESILDSEGNTWKEVPYLAQDTIFEDVENIGSNDPELSQYSEETPYLLKLKRVPRRFITKFLENGTIQIHFGGGISDKDDEQIIPNPDNIGLGIKDNRTKLTEAYDPSNFLYTRAYGQAPSNTTLSVTYLKGGGIESNVSANTITEVTLADISKKPNLVQSVFNYCKESLACVNPLAALGGGTGDSVEELRMNTIAAFGAQNRAVTKEDYIIRTYSLPPKFGRVAKAYITQNDQLLPYTDDPNRTYNPLALNLYILGFNNTKNLTKLNAASKQNVATYLEQHRMLTDTINIKDAYYINVSVDFEVISFKSYSNEEVVLNCINELKEYFDIDKWQINQPLITQELSNLLGTVEGVMNVQNITIENLYGESKGYSKYKYDIEGATKRGVIYPSLDPSIFEVRYPNTDIKGRVTTY